MVERRQVELMFHASVLLLIGLLCGVLYSVTITDSLGQDAVRAWRFSKLWTMAA
jgi:hypothetical protein